MTDTTTEMRALIDELTARATSPYTIQEYDQKLYQRAADALILRQAPDAGGEPVAWRVRFDLGYNDEWAVTTVKPPPGSIEAGYAQPLYLAPDTAKEPTDA